MEPTEMHYFELMKTKIVDVMHQRHAGISQDIADWKGNEIFEFQEDLKNKVNAYFSEKWFYNHFKSPHKKLPRIDLLNILSRYTGYADWSDFKYKNKVNISIPEASKGSNRVFYILPVLALIVFSVTWGIIRVGSIATYTFCFVDRDSKEPIRNTGIEIVLFNENESPTRITCDSTGCFVFRTNRQKVKFAVNAPYYFPDTISRLLTKNKRKEDVELKVNDYALMIYYYVNSKVEDWERRKEQLNRIIADSAYICQVFNGGKIGMELYNKQEFIDMLTTPVRGLKHFRIIEIYYTNHKVTSLRFSRD